MSNTRKRDRAGDSTDDFPVQREELLTSIRSLREYSAALTHELRGSVGSLKGFTEILMEEYPHVLDERGLHLLERVWFNAGQLDLIIKNLEDISFEGQENQPREAVEPADMAAQVLEAHAEQIRQARVEVIISKNLPTLWINPTKLWRLLENLFSNAVKAVDEAAKPVINFDCRPVGTGWVFFIEDSGSGIPAIKRESVFNLFQRFDQNHSGSGVGLTVARRIVEFYSGRIWIEDGSLGGARFCFSFGPEVF
ncbi:MAG: HAMP domain-containing histidine kinase, partial [Deltaproteobacteria bacterium]|nr:HAMP domain-containing histidine kinase [Deltaproteobacteria bacterium]